MYVDSYEAHNSHRVWSMACDLSASAYSDCTQLHPNDHTHTYTATETVSPIWFILSSAPEIQLVAMAMIT